MGSTSTTPYGDDDLTTGSITPFQLFLIFCELVAAGGGRVPELAYMIDQSHNLKDPIEDLIQSTEAVLLAYAQALLVDREALRAAQDGNDPALAQEILQAAFRTDVRPLAAEARRRNGAALGRWRRTGPSATATPASPSGAAARRHRPVTRAVAGDRADRPAM